MIVLPNGMTKLENMVASGNRHRLYTEDGGGTVNDGRYLAGPFKIPCGDADQQYEMMIELIRVDQEEGFQARFGSFPHECLTYNARRDLFIPDFRKKVVNWRRIRGGILRACKEKLGE